MDRLLDRIITLIFVIALGVIIYFIALWAKAAISNGNINQDTSISANDSREYGYDEEHQIYDAEDTEYYDSKETTPREEKIELTEEIPDAESLYRDVPKDTKTVPNTAPISPKEYDVKTPAIPKNKGVNTPKTVSTTAPTTVPVPKPEPKQEVVVKPVAPTTPTSEFTAKSGTVNTVKKSVNTGKYMVMAGSFASKVNAESQVTKLKKLGYTPVIKSTITPGKFNVIAGFYADKNGAGKIVSKLKAKKIDSYVRTRK